jgi:bacterioferritin-associated ferredoxin
MQIKRKGHVALDYRPNINENGSHYKRAGFMYVCICNGITERDIHAAAADGATTLQDLCRELGIASGCGKCASCARECLREATCAEGTAPALQAA